MRALKFRVWSQSKSLMLEYGFKLHCTGELYSDFYFVSSDDPVMQFTGLLDANGKEIYEGDIVVKNEYIWFDDEGPNYRGVVEWVFSQWQVVARCVNSKKRGISDGTNTGLNDDGIEEGDESEWVVLGNIYENPDLLEAQ